MDNREQIKTPDATSFGTNVHDILDHYYDLVTPETTIAEVPDLVERAYTELGNWALDKRKTAKRKTQQSFIRFEKKRIRQNLGMPTLREKMLYATISPDLPKIYGKMDVYFETGGLIIDWKTGKWAELSDSLKIQGKIYKLLLEANGYHPKKIIFDFVVVGKRVILPEVSTTWVIGKIEDMMEQINNKKYIKNREGNGLCNKWCGYRLDCDLDEMCPMVIP